MRLNPLKDLVLQEFGLYPLGVVAREYWLTFVSFVVLGQSFRPRLPSNCHKPY